MLEEKIKTKLIPENDARISQPLTLGGLNDRGEYIVVRGLLFPPEFYQKVREDYLNSLPR